MKVHNDIEQGTLDWHFIRKGKITGTVLKDILGTPRARQEAFYELIAERLTEGVSAEDENARDRGHRLEDEARAIFEFRTQKSVETVGFCEKDSNPFITNSPDGLIKNGDVYDEAIEIKCFEGKKFVKTWFTNTVPDEYWAQVLQYFIVNEQLQTLYFVAYCPEITMYPMHVITIHRENIVTDIAEAEAAQVAFLEEVQEKLKEIIII